MKMSEVFTGGKVVEIGGYYDNDAYINTEEHGFGTDEDGVADAVIHAINMHDELVEALDRALNCYDDDGKNCMSDDTYLVLTATLEKAKS